MSNLTGQFQEEIILQIMKPLIIDVSTVDYNAQALNVNTLAIDINLEAGVRPFIICSNEEVTLKVETWKGDVITWTFSAGPYPMPLRKVYNDAANTLTTIQIGY